MRGGGRQRNVPQYCKAKPRTGGRTIDRRDQRLFHRGEPMDAGVETARKGADRRFGVLPGGGEGVDVAADAEIFAASGEDDGAYVPLRRASLRQFMKAECELRIDGVELDWKSVRIGKEGVSS